MKSILDQTIATQIDLEFIVFLDACVDQTEDKVMGYQNSLASKGITLRVLKNSTIRKGVGYGRNRAIEVSSGEYLCFLDIDDVMYPTRIEQQLAAAKRNQNAVIFALIYW